MIFSVICDGKVLIEAEDNIFALPTNEDILCSLPELREVSTFFMSHDNLPVKVCVSDTETPLHGYEWVELRKSFDLLSALDYSVASKARELVFWDQQTRFCGVCGSSLAKRTEISKYCPVCDKEFWPHVSIAIIVLIRRDDEILLTRNKNFKGNYWGLVAGFVETGETIEECVEREVLEETGIVIKNLHYVTSQPWPYPSNLMLGFMADYASGDIKVQEEELIDAQWFHRDNLPEVPGKVSLARRLIDLWLAKSEAF